MSSSHTDSPLWVGDIFVGGIGFQIHANFQRAQVGKQAEAQMQSQIQDQAQAQMQKGGSIDSNNKLCPYHQKIEDEKQNAKPKPSEPQRTAPATRSFHYCRAEKKWMKKRFGNEWKFLRQYGLNMHKPGDRVKGRRLIQGFVQHDMEQRHFRRPNGHHNGIDWD